MMLRTVFLQKPCQNIILHSKLKNVFQFGSPNDAARSTTLYSSCGAPGYFNTNEKDSNKNKRKYFRKQIVFLPKDSKLFHTDAADLAKEVKISALDLNLAAKEFFKINMTDLKQAPLPAFWVGFAGLIPFILPPVSSIIIGYSPFLASIELGYGIGVLAAVGGAKWGYLIANKEYGTWENYALSGVPLALATVAVACPKSISFLLVIAGLLAAFVVDLTTGHFPPWYASLRGVLTNISVFFLFISMLQFMIH